MFEFLSRRREALTIVLGKCRIGVTVAAGYQRSEWNRKEHLVRHQNQAFDPGEFLVEGIDQKTIKLARVADVEWLVGLKAGAHTCNHRDNGISLDRAVFVNRIAIGAHQPDEQAIVEGVVTE